MVALSGTVAEVAAVAAALGLEGGRASRRLLLVVTLAADLALGVALGACSCAFSAWKPQIPEASERLVTSSEHGPTLLPSTVHVYGSEREATRTRTL
jgi:hypothetical protein